jgi:UDP-N-acetyl-D-galactosamine dehydrogenase
MPETVAIVGLGYVGLPLAVAFGRQRPTIGYDLDENRLGQYRRGYDPSAVVSSQEIDESVELTLTSDPQSLTAADVILVAVPTPVDDAHRPDLEPLRAACRTVGANMRAGAIVIFESTVYPGCTEEVCVPILEESSGLRWCARGEGDSASGFSVGYSPERINPGDRENRLETIIKVVSGDKPETLEVVAALYESVVQAGVHRASSIKVAEASKVIENTQRDINIALMNELALIFNCLDIDTLDVLEAAGSKWNFLPFRPGLVGGHCIGVDPYYLTYKAEAVGHHPQVILAGRKTNDGMGKFVAEQTVKKLLQAGRPVHGAQVVILGLTFKEDCPDIRNSRVVDIISELADYQCEVYVHDPLADAGEAKSEYGVSLSTLDQLPAADALVFAVPHEQYLEWDIEVLLGLLAEGGILVDVKARLDRSALTAAGVPYWRL